MLAFTVEAAPAQVQTEQPTGEEVIVTARKRAEEAVDVPVSLGVYDQETLRRVGADDFADLADAVPGVSFATLSVGGSRVFIRGIGQVTTGQSPTTAFYLDEILLNQPRTTFGSAQPDLLLADIGRVEVLRGPQGALFGASALGGAVRPIANRPDPDARTLDGNAALVPSPASRSGPGWRIRTRASARTCRWSASQRATGSPTCRAGPSRDRPTTRPLWAGTCGWCSTPTRAG